MWSSFFYPYLTIKKIMSRMNPFAVRPHKVIKDKPKKETSVPAGEEKNTADSKPKPRRR